jgi:hypothetical protein
VSITSQFLFIVNVCLCREEYPEDGQRPEMQWETPTKLPHLAAVPNGETGIERWDVG